APGGMTRSLNAFRVARRSDLALPPQDHSTTEVWEIPSTSELSRPFGGQDGERVFVLRERKSGADSPSSRQRAGAIAQRSSGNRCPHLSGLMADRDGVEGAVIPVLRGDAARAVR